MRYVFLKGSLSYGVPLFLLKNYFLSDQIKRKEKYAPYKGPNKHPNLSQTFVENLNLLLRDKD